MRVNETSSFRGRLLLAAIGTIFAFSAGCSGGDDAPGPDAANCQSDADCSAPFVCASDSSGGNKTCRSPEPIGGGRTVTYCADVKPILDANCTTCHGESTVGSGRTDFRLDRYATEGMQKGAKEMAPRIKARAADQKTMPPPGSPSLSNEDRAVLGAWATQGAAECGP
jgi:hypothetical protein